MAAGEQFLYSGGADLTIRVWDIVTLEVVKVIQVSRYPLKNSVFDAGLYLYPPV